MSAAAAKGKTRVRSQFGMSVLMLVTMTFAWWWGDTSLVSDRAVLFATIIFVVFGFVVLSVIATAALCAGKAYREANGKWDFHIGWSVLSLLLLGLAALVVWVLSGTGPVGLDQLPWLRLPPNIIGVGWKYGVPYMFVLTIALIPSSWASNARTSETGSASRAASHGEGGGLSTFRGMMSSE